MKSVVAWVGYVFGGVFALRSVVAGLSGDHWFEWFTGIAFAIAVWWFAVGLGVRLGVHPDDFVASIRSTLGFGEDFDTEEPTPKVNDPA